MRHQREVAAVLGAERRDAVRRSVGAEGVILGGQVLVVGIAQRRLVVFEHVPLHLPVGEVHLPLAVRHPHAQRRSGHALEEDGVGLEDGERGVAALEAARLVVHEARLRRLRQQLVARGHPAEQGHELAAIAHAEGEGVLARAEVFELRVQVELDLGRPALGRVKHVRVREAANEGDAAELVERNAPAEQVGHGHVPRLQPAGKHGPRHVAVAVRPLLAQDGHARLARGEREARRGRGHGRERERPAGRRA
mmetsp:Transcript_14859/g.37607  ORF Transcript_14859/g.37607 Transcript_14859/m.37607 type:complete len:251 (+) Transcript_14859:440-1192(+)